MIPNEFCYRLNIPDFTEIVRDDWKHNLDWNAIRKVPVVLPVEKVIQEQYLNFNNINWQNIIRFPVEPGASSFIHSDNYGELIGDNLENPKIILFAINFIVTGSGVMDYYLPSQLGTTPFFDPTDPYKQKNWTTHNPPHKSYELTKGAYLFNITVPHKATPYSERIAMSMRPNITGGEHAYLWSKSWADIVNMFKEYIVE